MCGANAPLRGLCPLLYFFFLPFQLPFQFMNELATLCEKGDSHLSLLVHVILTKMELHECFVYLFIRFGVLATLCEKREFPFVFVRSSYSNKKGIASVFVLKGNTGQSPGGAAEGRLCRAGRGMHRAARAMCGAFAPLRGLRPPLPQFFFYPFIPRTSWRHFVRKWDSHLFC